MGAAQSTKKAFECQDDIKQFEKALDFFCGSCHCTTEYDADYVINNSQKRRYTQNGNGGSSQGGTLLNQIMVPASSKFNLNVVHKTSEPYLGSSYWEQVDEEYMYDDDNILDISSHGPVSDNEFLPQLNLNAPLPLDAVTPPRCVELNTSNEHVSSPSFLLQKSVSFSSPTRLLKRSRTECSVISETSIRTGTTTSTGTGTDLNAIETTYSSSLEGSSHDNVRISFVPRRLFDTSDEFRNFDSSERNDQEISCSGSTSASLRSNRLSPPRAPMSSHDYIESPSRSTDQSIMIRNGVLVKEMPLPSPQSVCRKSSAISTRYLPDGFMRDNMRQINTLPSFKEAYPIRLKIKESYAGYETRDMDDENDVNNSNTSLLSDAEQAHFFSYDPYFSLGQYIITTLEGNAYGNGMSVKMGERYMTLQDKNGRVWGIMRSRHTWIPSAIIYSPKARYPTQTPSSHRPCGDGIVSCEDSVELFPWALVRKHGRSMDHDVSIHMVSESRTNSELVGGLFEKAPSYRSRHGFDEQDNHHDTVVCKMHGETEIPCCVMVRDTIKRDVFDVTIGPGIDPLMIICYMAVHSKMVSSDEIKVLHPWLLFIFYLTIIAIKIWQDVEPKLCDN